MANPGPDKNGDRDRLAALLGLAEVPGIGAARIRMLVGAFGDPLAAVRAPRAALERLPGFTGAGARAVRAVSLERGRAILQELDRLGARVLTEGDPEFPPLLREIPDAPFTVFVWGDAALLARPAAAIVGSRDHSSYGAEVARGLASGLARAGVVVVSGMARGIDALAHSAALDAGGASVGVLGNGFGVVYPAANRALYDRMAAAGCLVTEFPPGERPHAGAFPRRNRLISGLAMVTVVVEARAQSGALNTADRALDQGRGVLAVPGPITSPTSVGCNRLIQQGAKPVLGVADVLEELGLPEPAASPFAGGSPATPRDLSPLEQTLWAALAGEARHIDALVAAAGADVGAVLTALTDMELRGLVSQRPGMVFAVA
ncbi:MAG TPA: DNA-processing protein DprA [Gemmatimonadales bacterium]|nr:DNA-processing protein DprA [Gemmatimonadales bacterium]